MAVLRCRSFGGSAVRGSSRTLKGMCRGRSSSGQPRTPSKGLAVWKLSCSALGAPSEFGDERKSSGRRPGLQNDPHAVAPQMSFEAGRRVDPGSIALATANSAGHGGAQWPPLRMGFASRPITGLSAKLSPTRIGSRRVRVTRSSFNGGFGPKSFYAMAQRP